MTLPPQQTRSQRTLDNLLDAATTLLEEKSFDELTINDIITQAGSSVGSFYARFKDKDALLHALDDRFADDFLATGQAFIDQGTRPDSTLAEVVHEIVTLLYQMHTTHMGLLRTLILRARLSDDPRFREREARINDLFPGTLAILLAHADEITHPNPELAAQFGLTHTLYALREMVLWPHIAANIPVKGDALISELTRAFVNYLKSG